MKVKKAMALMLAAAAAVSATTGCKDKETASGEKVVLKYVMPGPGIQEDSQKVWDEFNKKLQEKLPGVEVTFDIISLSEYKQQFMLMQTTNEQIDIANVYGLDFYNEVKNGTFEPVDELVEEYGQETKSALPEWLWEYMKVDGKLYGIPSYQMMSVVYGLRTQKEYADKWLDVEGLKNELYSNDVTTDKAYNILEDYFIKLKENGKLSLGTDIWLQGLNNGKNEEGLTSNFVVKIGDPEHKVYYQYTSDETKKNYEHMADWFSKGYIRKDIMSANDYEAKKGLMDGGYILWSSPGDPWSEKSESEKYGVEILNIPVSDKYYIPFNNAAAGTAVMTKSKYKKEAMQVMNLLQSDKELYNLLVFGIKDEHYTKEGEDTIVTPYGGQATSNEKYGLYKWIVGNTSLSYSTQDEPEGYKEWVFDEVNNSDYRSEYTGFVPDLTEFSEEISQINAIKSEYMASLQSGSLADWEASYNEWMQKAKLAGVDKVAAELQTQINEFLRNK